MKKLVIGIGMLISPSLIAEQYEELPPANYDEAIPSDDILQLEYQQQKFQEILEEVKTHEIFSGRSTELKFKGQLHVIDRTQEQVKYQPGSAKQPSKSVLGSLINDLNIRGRATVRITITTEVFKNGVIETRDIWTIDASGMWQAQTGFDEARQKNHQ